ncbi:MAG: hypothetical protein M8354_15275, partial [Halalkalicoccus sp.]|nr:hypothetical protein [Halalkalicoccus sp.]
MDKETSARSRTANKSAVCFQYTRDGEEMRVRLARDADPSESDSITISEPDGRDYSDKLPEYQLPGAGELGSDCGEEFPGLYCTDCFAPHTVGRTCRNPDCPRCWQSWAFHRAKDMASKLEALGREEYAQNGKKVKQHHVTISLRDSTRFNSKDPFKQGIEAVKALTTHVDIPTGFTVYHPFRIAPAYRGDVLGHESGDGNMTWKDVLEKIESEGWSWQAVREEFLVYAPHFHVICLSEFVDTTSVAAIEEKTGAVIHRITTTREDGNEKSIANTEELCKVTAYCLSHSGIAPSEERKTHRAAVRAFGKVANYEAFDSA